MESQWSIFSMRVRHFGTSTNLQVLLGKPRGSRTSISVCVEVRSAHGCEPDITITESSENTGPSQSLGWCFLKQTCRVLVFCILLRCLWPWCAEVGRSCFALVPTKPPPLYPREHLQWEKRKHKNWLYHINSHAHLNSCYFPDFSGF